MLDLGLTATPASTAASAFPDVSTQNFERDVLHASMAKPVIVQFWAPWCGPCKQLKPVMEKAVTAANDSVAMVRVNIDTSPDLAQALRVQSVPMVYAFYQGQAVDGFVGVRPESEIKTFVDKLAKLGGAAPVEGAADPEAVKKTIAEADAFFAEGKMVEAMASYSTAYDMDPAANRALAGIAWCFVAEKDSEAFDAVLGELTPEQQADKDLAGALHLRALREQGLELDALSLAQAVEADPKNHAARFDLARAQLASLDIEGALNSLLAIIRAARDWNDGAARTLLIEILDALGNAHPLVKPARRQLSAVLFS